MTEQKSAGSSPSTTSTTSTKTTTQPPKTDEDKDIESQSRTWGGTDKRYTERPEKNGKEIIRIWFFLIAFYQTIINYWLLEVTEVILMIISRLPI